MINMVLNSYQMVVLGWLGLSLLMISCRPEFRFQQEVHEVVEGKVEGSTQAEPDPAELLVVDNDDNSGGHESNPSTPHQFVQCSYSGRDEISIMSDKRSVNVGELIKFQICCSLPGSNIMFNYGDDNQATPSVGGRSGALSRARSSVTGYKYFIPGHYTVRGICCNQGPGGGKKLQKTINVQVRGSEDLYIRTHSSDVGRGEEVRFHGWCKYGNAQIKWDLGDGTQATGHLVVHKYSQVRDYKVTAQCGTSSDPATASVQVKVLSRPVRRPQPDFCADPSS